MEWAASQPLIPAGEQSSLLTRIATTESVFVMHADEKLTAFTELESVIQALPKPFLRQHRSCMPRQMEFVTLCCVAILVVSCSSIDDKIRSTPIADLRLRREQLIYRLNGAEWGPGAREHREDLYEEKEAIERELLPREKAGISDSDLRRACLRSRQDFVETGIAKRT